MEVYHMAFPPVDAQASVAAFTAVAEDFTAVAAGMEAVAGGNRVQYLTAIFKERKDHAEQE
jgi:hypothetical protein